jgi:nitrate reductase beta subunit
MARVRNWQIGRHQSYWYPESRPRRQFAAVFDTNKCIACQTCTIACKTTWTSGRGQETHFWNNVETKPYGFYPLAWDVNVLDLLGPQTWSGGRYEGRTIFEAAGEGERVLGYLPEEADYAHPNIGEDEIVGSVDRGAHITLPQDRWMFYLARICNHCTYPACLAACPRGSIYKRPEDGIVLVDQRRCRGYQECVRACPYKKSFFNPSTSTSEKCIACFPKTEAGLAPQCFTACIGKIRLRGWVNTPERAERDNPIDYLVHERGIALPLYPQLGLEPNVYYIPPVHVPTPFLRQMFGPGADRAVEAYRNVGRDTTLHSLLALFGSTERALSYFAVEGDEVAGFDEERREVRRVPVREPVIVRPYDDPAYQIRRHNTT